MAISKQFIPHTELKAEDLNELIGQTNDFIQAVSAQATENQTDIAGIKSKTDSISKQSSESEEEAIIYETDGGTQVGKIDSNGADFTNLKRGGQQVARMSDLPTKDTSIGDTPSTTNVPTTKAVKDYVDAHSGGDYPIDKESTQSETEEQVWGNDAETLEYAKIGSYGMKSKAYLDMQGDSIIESEIGDSPCTSHAPSVKAVKDYVDMHSVGNLPISNKEIQEDSEEQIWGNGSGNDVYVKIGSYGLKAKNITDIDGNPIGGDINYTNIVPAYAAKYGKTITEMKRGCDFNALFFSDIHGRSAELQRIVQYGNAMKASLNCIIDGGDDTSAFTSTTPLTWFDTDIANSELPCIRAVGNHDAWASNYWVWDSNENIYTMMTSKVVADLTNRGITVHQPSDVATTYKNYYYVDFGNVRIVVLLSLIYAGFNAYWDADQKDWLESVLADALTNEKHVLIVNHGPLNPASINEVNLSPNWNSFISWEGFVTKIEPYCKDTQHLSDEAVALVDDFIEDGGNFIAYIAGHTHGDYILETKNTTHKQYCIVTSCARNGSSDAYTPPLGNLGYDLFNWIGIDTSKKLFKMLRLGNNTTYAQNEHNMIVINYQSKKIITSK